MWKDFQDQEEPKEPHDDPQQWGNDGGRYTDRFWKKDLFKRFQVGGFEKGSRDWAISHCKIGEIYLSIIVSYFDGLVCR